MTKHSPAPWTSDGNQVLAADGTVVCETYDANETDVANNALIVAAPDMREALELLNSLSGRQQTNQFEWIQAWKAAEVALTKIRGNK